MQLVQPKRILCQLDSFVSLTLRLFRNGCQRGSLQIANRLSFLLSEFESPLEDSRIANFLNMIIYLEKYPTMADPQRFAHVVTFFRRVETSLRCFVASVINFEHKSVPSCRELYRQLCSIIARSEDLRESDVQGYFLVFMMKNFAVLEDDELLIDFIDNLFRNSFADNTTVDSNVPADRMRLEQFLWDPWIRENPLIATRISHIPITKKIFHEMVNAQMDIVKEIDKSKRSKHGSGTQNSSSNSLTVDPIIDQPMINCLNFFSFIDQYPSLGDSKLSGKFIGIISKRPIIQVVKLFSNLPQSECDLARKSDLGSPTINFLLNRILLEKEKESLQKFLSISSYLFFAGILKRFIWLENETGIKLAINFLCNNDIEKSWDRCDVISRLLNPDNGFLGDFDSPFVSRFSFKILPLIVNPLLKAWVEGAANLVNWETFETTSPVVDELKLKLRCVTHDAEFEPVVDGMIQMFASLFKLEKKWPGNEMTKACLDSAAGLCKSYPFKVLRELVALLYFLFIKEGSAFKSNCPICSNVVTSVKAFVLVQILKILYPMPKRIN